MEILKGSKDRKSEINQYVDYHNSNPQEISLDKWVNDAKANKAAYEAGKEPLDELLKKINDYNLEETRWICDNFPCNLVQYSHPHLVIEKEGILCWNEDAVLLIMKQDYQVKEQFKRYVGNELLDYIGLEKEQREDLMIQNGWLWSDILEYGLKKYHDLDY